MIELVANNTNAHLVMGGLKLVRDGERINRLHDKAQRVGRSYTAVHMCVQNYDKAVAKWKKEATKEMKAQGFIK